MNDQNVATWLYCPECGEDRDETEDGLCPICSHVLSETDGEMDDEWGWAFLPYDPYNNPAGFHDEEIDDEDRAE